MTIRPPGRVTRTISRATSNGRGANIAPKVRCVAFLETQVRKASRGSSSSSRRDEVGGNVDTKNVSPTLSCRKCSRSIAAAEVEHVHSLPHTQRCDQILTAFAHRRGDPREVTLFP
jgi:hypothetical protein